MSRTLTKYPSSVIYKNLTRHHKANYLRKVEKDLQLYGKRVLKLLGQNSSSLILEKALLSINHSVKGYIGALGIDEEIVSKFFKEEYKQYVEDNKYNKNDLFVKYLQQPKRNFSSFDLEQNYKELIQIISLIKDLGVDVSKGLKMIENSKIKLDPILDSKYFAFDQTKLIKKGDRESIEIESKQKEDIRKYHKKHRKEQQNELKKYERMDIIESLCGNYNLGNKPNKTIELILNNKDFTRENNILKKHFEQAIKSIDKLSLTNLLMKDGVIEFMTEIFDDNIMHTAYGMFFKTCPNIKSIKLIQNPKVIEFVEGCTDLIELIFNIYKKGVIKDNFGLKDFSNRPKIFEHMKREWEKHENSNSVDGDINNDTFQKKPNNKISKPNLSHNSLNSGCHYI